MSLSSETGNLDDFIVETKHYLDARIQLTSAILVKIESSLVLHIIRIFPRRFERLNMREYTQLSEDERYTKYVRETQGQNEC